MKRAVDFFNEIPTFWLIFFLLCVNHILPITTENEDMYYGLAMQYINPDWIPNSFVFTESPGTRLLFQWLIGPLLLVFSAETVSIIGQLVCYAFYAFSLTKIFKFFSINNTLIFFLLQLVFIKLQAFTGGEWIFRNFETKSIAYIFIFFSVQALIDKDWKKSVLWAVPAFYFHVLVGGWYFMALILFFLLKKMSFRTLVIYGLLFLLLVSPYLIYLLNDILVSQEKIIDGINLDWVYTYYRNPHHTVTWHMGWPWFRKFRAEGLGMIILASIVGITIYQSRSISEVAKNIWLFCFATYIMLFAMYGLSYFDLTGKLLKFYVYRIGSISFLLTLILLLHQLVLWLSSKKFSYVFYLILIIVSSIALPKKIDKIVTEQLNSNNNKDYQELVSYLKREGNPGEVIAFFDNTIRTYIPRKTRLEPVVSFKFVPSGTEKLYEWYQRMEETKKVENNPQLLDAYLKKYNVKFILTKSPIDNRRVDFKVADCLIYKN